MKVHSGSNNSTDGNDDRVIVKVIVIIVLLTSGHMTSLLCLGAPNETSVRGGGVGGSWERLVRVWGWGWEEREGRGREWGREGGGRASSE